MRRIESVIIGITVVSFSYLMGVITTGMIYDPPMKQGVPTTAYIGFAGMLVALVLTIGDGITRGDK